MELREFLEQAKKQLAEVTGLKPVAVPRFFKDDQGWHVCVEMLEMTRIPTATDLLGEYEALLDEGGRVLKFERTRTRLRGEPVEAKAG